MTISGIISADVHHPAMPEYKATGRCPLPFHRLLTVIEVFSWGYRFVLVTPTPCCPLPGSSFPGGDGD